MARSQSPTGCFFDLALEERAVFFTCRSLPALYTPSTTVPSAIVDIVRNSCYGQMPRLQFGECEVLCEAAPTCPAAESNYSLGQQREVTTSVFTSLPDLARFDSSGSAHLLNHTLHCKSCVSLTNLDFALLMPGAREFPRERNRDSVTTRSFSLSMCNLNNLCSTTGRFDRSLSNFDPHFLSGDCRSSCANVSQDADTDAITAQRDCCLADGNGTISSVADSPDEHYLYVDDLGSEFQDDLLPGFRHRNTDLSESSAGSSNESECTELLYSDRSYSTDSRDIRAQNITTRGFAQYEANTTVQDSICISASLETTPEPEVVPKTDITGKKDNLDADKDILNPAYVPRAGTYFMHDYRASECGKDIETVNAVKSRADCGKWQHDLFRYHDQAPRSDREIIWRYGRNIRIDDAATTDSRTSVKPLFADHASDHLSLTHRTAGLTATNHFEISTVNQAPAGRPQSHIRHGKFTRSSATPHVHTNPLTTSDINPRPEYTGSFRNRHFPSSKTHSVGSQQVLQTDSPITHSAGTQDKVRGTAGNSHHSFLIPMDTQHGTLDRTGHERTINQRYSNTDLRWELNQGGFLPKRYSTLRQKSLLSTNAEVGNITCSRFDDRNHVPPYDSNTGSFASDHLSNGFATSRQPSKMTSNTRDGPSENMHRRFVRSPVVHSDTRRVFHDSPSHQPSRSSGPSSSPSTKYISVQDSFPLSRSIGRNELHDRTRALFYEEQTRALAPSMRTCRDNFEKDHLSQHLENQTHRNFMNRRRPLLGKKTFATQEFRDPRDNITRSILVE